MADPWRQHGDYGGGYDNVRTPVNISSIVIAGESSNSSQTSSGYGSATLFQQRMNHQAAGYKNDEGGVFSVEGTKSQQHQQQRNRPQTLFIGNRRQQQQQLLQQQRHQQQQQFREPPPCRNHSIRDSAVTLEDSQII